MSTVKPKDEGRSTKNSSLKSMEEEEVSKMFDVEQKNEEDHLTYYLNKELKIKDLIFNKRYNTFEEVSAQGYGRTILYYSMLYGKLKTITFILDYLQ